jgi:acyl-CoA dehydrogenase
MALVVKFMANYFFNPEPFAEIPRRDDPSDDTFLFDPGPAKGLGKIRFHDYRIAYDSVDLPNVQLFRAQIDALKDMLMTAPPGEDQRRDIDFLLSLGELFSLVAYGQLIIEKARMDDVPDHLLDRIFDFMVRDFSKFALQIHGKPSSTEQQMECCLSMIRKPKVSRAHFRDVWEKHVLALKGAYEMNP